MTFDEFADAALGLDDHELTLRVLAGFFSRAGNRFSCDSSRLVLVDGTIAGLLIAYPGRELVRRSVAMFVQAFAVYGFRDTLRLVRRSWIMFVSRDALPDEYYIAHLAVAPNFQRRGIARLLLEETHRQARAAGFQRISLLCDWGHDPARALYLSNGFRVAECVATPSMETTFHFTGYERLLKDLPQED